VRNTTRRLTIGQAMILIVAVTVSLALIRTRSDLVAIGPGGTLRLWGPRGSSLDSWLYLAKNWAFVATPCLGLTSLALLALTLAPPRPRMARLMRHPGATAMLVVGVSILVRGMFLIARELITLARSGTWESFTYLSDSAWAQVIPFAICTGGAVGSAWMVISLSGTWQRPRDWLEMSSRILGWVWIAMIPLWSWLFKTR